MDPQLKNLREWVALLFFLFCALDIAGMQYGIKLAATAPSHPDPVVGQIVAVIRGSRGAWHTMYVTTRQESIFYGFLGAAAAALLATLGLIVAHGVLLIRAQKALRPASVRSVRRKRQDDPRSDF
jgi:hypothetical protein